MALETAVYLVTEEIARRSGLIGSRHRTQDGRFILNDRDLSRVRFTTDEYISGLQGVEKITPAEAKTLIRQNDFATGAAPSAEATEENAPAEEAPVTEGGENDNNNDNDSKEEEV